MEKRAFQKNWELQGSTPEKEFTQVPNKLIRSEALTSNAKDLFLNIISNTEDWEINLKVYSKKFGWCPKKQAKLVDELSANGYLKVVKRSKGKGDIRHYFYVSTEGSLTDEYVVQKELERKQGRTPPETAPEPQQAPVIELPGGSFKKPSNRKLSSKPISFIPKSKQLIVDTIAIHDRMHSITNVERITDEIMDKVHKSMVTFNDEISFQSYVIEYYNSKQTENH